MSHPLFRKGWWDNTKRQLDSAMEKFKAACQTARSGSDEAVKQVVPFNLFKIMAWVTVIWLDM